MAGSVNERSQNICDVYNMHGVCVCVYVLDEHCYSLADFVQTFTGLSQ